MAKLNIEYGKIKKDGSRAVMIRLVSGKTQKHIPTHVTLEKGEYKIYSDGRIKITNDAKFFEVEDFISDIKKKLNQIMRENYGLPITADYIVRKIFRPSTSDVRNKNFFDFADEWVESSKIKSINSYKVALNNLAAFLGVRYLAFAEINVEFLTRWSKSLSDMKRAQSMYLACFRHIYKQACLIYNDDDNTPLSANLFERFKIPKQKASIPRALSVEDIRTIFNLPYKKKGVKYNIRFNLAKDCFILSFCLMGMNAADLYDVGALPDETYKDGYITYHRRKTMDRRSDGAFMKIRVHPIIKELIDKYRGKDRLFCFSERFSSTTSFNKALNLGLKHIGKILGIDNLQFYSARHSMATIAYNNVGIDKWTVNDMLCHTGEIMKVTDIYIKKDFTPINKANYRLLKYMFDTKE